MNTDLISIHLQAFKAAYLFSSYNLQKIKLDSLSLTVYRRFHFISPSNLAELKEEFLKYVILTEEGYSEYMV